MWASRQRVELTKQTQICDSFLPSSFLSFPPTSLSNSDSHSLLLLCIFYEPNRAIVMSPSCFHGDEVQSVASESLAPALLTCPRDFQACMSTFSQVRSIGLMCSFTHAHTHMDTHSLIIQILCFISMTIISAVMVVQRLYKVEKIFSSDVEWVLIQF